MRWKLSICKIVYWHAFLQFTLTPANKPVLSMCIWQSHIPQGIYCQFSLSYCHKKWSANQKGKVKHFMETNYWINCVLTQTLTSLYHAQLNKQQLLLKHSRIMSLITTNINNVKHSFNDLISEVNSMCTLFFKKSILLHSPQNTKFTQRVQIQIQELPHL